MTSVDSNRNSTSNDENSYCDYFFGDSERISSGLSAGGPNLQFEDSGLNPVSNLASGSFLYTDSSGGDSGIERTGFAGYSSSSRRETDWGRVGPSEGKGAVLLRRPTKERSAQTFYS